MAQNDRDSPVSIWAAISRTTNAAILGVIAGANEQPECWFPRSAILNKADVKEDSHDWQLVQLKKWVTQQKQKGWPDQFAKDKPKMPPNAALVPNSQQASANAPGVPAGKKVNAHKKEDVPGEVFQAFEKMDSMQIQAINDGQIIGEFFYQTKFKDKKTGKMTTRTGMSAHGAQAMTWSQKESDNPICFGPPEFDAAADAILNPPGQPKQFACVMVSAWYTKTPEAKVWGNSAEPIDTTDPRYRYVATTAASKARRNAVFYLVDPVEKLKAIKAYEEMLKAIRTPALGAPKSIQKEAEEMEKNQGTTIIDSELSEKQGFSEPTEEEINDAQQIVAEIDAKEQKPAAQSPSVPKPEPAPAKPAEKPAPKVPEKPAPKQPAGSEPLNVETMEIDDKWGKMVENWSGGMFYQKPEALDLAREILKDEGRFFLDNLSKAFGEKVVTDAQIQDIFTTAASTNDVQFLRRFYGIIVFLVKKEKKKANVETWKTAFLKAKEAPTDGKS